MDKTHNFHLLMILQDDIVNFLNKETTKTAAAATDKLVNWFSKNIKKYANTTVTWDGNEYTL